jgi:hypothetical protein
MLKSLKDVLSDIHKGSLSWNDIMPIVELISVTEWLIPDRCKTGYFRRENIKNANIEIVTLFDPREEHKGWTFRIDWVLGPPLIDNDTRYLSMLEATQTAIVMFSELYENEFHKYAIT